MQILTINSIIQDFKGFEHLTTEEKIDCLKMTISDLQQLIKIIEASKDKDK